MKKFNEREIKIVILNQKNEINGYHIYKNLSEAIKDKNNRKILKRIADNEKTHYTLLKKISNIEVKPDKFKIFLYTISAKIWGLTFTLKLLEIGEKNADNSYSCLKKKLTDVSKILKDEDRHEHELLRMINEEKLNYMGSVVLGLNDALVEFTGALAGYTLAMQNSRAIAMIGLITGISATLSMASSEFFSKRQEKDFHKAVTSCIYTGLAYIITVILLVLPFLILANPYINLIVTILTAIIIIFLFNFYISTAKELEFKERFLEMTVISLGVAFVSFIIGWLIKIVMGINL